MKKSRHTESQIIRILKEVESGRKVKEVWYIRCHLLQLEEQIWWYAGIRYQASKRA